MTRSQRERRAYQLTLATGAAGVATVVAIFFSIPLAFLLAVLTGVLGFALKRTLGR